jgi:hypothetical protein
MKFSTSQRSAAVFVPAACGNRSAPREEQLRVTIQPIGVADYEALRAAQFAATESPDAAEIAKSLRAELLSTRVRSVSGVEGETMREGESPGAFLIRVVESSNDAEHSRILDEVMGAIVSASTLNEGLAKN